jgi:hypothetical protein
VNGYLGLQHRADPPRDVGGGARLELPIARQESDERMLEAKQGQAGWRAEGGLPPKPPGSGVDPAPLQGGHGPSAPQDPGVPIAHSSSKESSGPGIA